MNNSVQIIGLAAALLTSVSMIPQAVKSIRYQQYKELSMVTYSFLVSGVILWIIYGVIQKDWPVILANSIAFIPTSLILILKLKNK